MPELDPMRDAGAPVGNGLRASSELRSTPSIPRTPNIPNASTPITTVDRFGHDRGHQPLWCNFLLTFDGRVDQARLSRAIEVTLQRHPVLASCCDLVRDDMWRAVPTDAVDVIRQATWANESEFAGLEEAWVNEPANLAHDLPFRVLLAHGPDRDRMLVTLHHAVSDGTGGFVVLRTLRAAYVADDDDTGTLAERDATPRSLEWLVQQRGTTPWRLWLRLVLARKWQHRQPAGGGFDHPTASFGPRRKQRWLTLDADVVVPLFDAAKSSGCTINDALMAVVAVAWRDVRRSIDLGAAAFVVSIPIDVRKRFGVPSMGVANFVGHENPVVAANHFDDADFIVHVISAAQRVRAPDAGILAFLHFHVLSRLLPRRWLVPRIAALAHRAARSRPVSCLFSNVAHPPRELAQWVTLTVDDLRVTGPAPTCLTIVASSWQQRLHLVTAYPEHLVTEAIADRIPLALQRAVHEVTQALPRLAPKLAWPSAR